MFEVSCIGTKHLGSEEKRQTCFKLGAWIVKCGGTIYSGNASNSYNNPDPNRNPLDSADFAYASGANSVDPTKVVLLQPWGGQGFNLDQVVMGNRVVLPPYPQWMEELTMRLHPRGPYLKRGALALHTRNVAIVKPTQLCLAYPSDKLGGGGTGQGMRVAEHYGIELINLNHYGTDELRALCERIRHRLS
jgi:hypothetical protein